MREKRELEAWCEEKRGHGSSLYRCSGLYQERSEPDTAMDMIH
jgi:hypothetical protein